MASTTGNSFQKRTKLKIPQIPGTKPSIQNNQLLVSTGIPSLDNLIGGGLAVGTVILVEEDEYHSYARMMLKYFIAEAVMAGHALHVSSIDLSPEQILTELPGPVLDDPGLAVRTPSVIPGAGGEDQLKIAWRYQNLPKVQSSSMVGGSKFGHYYDLTKTMPDELLSATEKTVFNWSDEPIRHRTATTGCPNNCYQRLLQSIDHAITSGGFHTAAITPKRNILRIAIHSLGSPLWGENCGKKPAAAVSSSSSFDPSLPRFLYGLRSLLRNAYATCMITVPTHLFQDVSFVRRLERLCDTVVRLESFAGSNKKNLLYKEYHGLFHLVKLPRLNSLTCHIPETFDWAFKLRRKKFTIEKLHLPPEFSDSTGRSQEDPVIMHVSSVPTSSCGSTGVHAHNLDF